VLWHSVSPTTLGHLRDAVATVPAFGPRRPVYAVLHRATFERLSRSALTRRSARALVRRVDAFVFQSEHLARRCAAVVPPEKRVVIPHTVDEAAACTAGEVGRRLADGPGRPLRLLFLSHMIREKGYLDVVEAAGRLRQRGVPFRLDMAGGWPRDGDRAAFEARVRAAGVADAVVHHGALRDRAEVRRLHLAADVFLLPTYHPTETQPIAILEALGAGTPVVSVDRPILHDIVPGGGGGALVPPRAPGALADAVERLAEPGAWAAAAAAARARYEAAFAPEAVRDRWLALLDRDRR
jgi:glycosyltransferase involved in cell wall biosynthesis